MWSFIDPVTDPLFVFPKIFRSPSDPELQRHLLMGLVYPMLP
jgi:hypothetical protein